MNVNPETPDRLGRAVRILATVLALAIIGRGFAYIGPAAPVEIPDSLRGLHAIMPMWAWSIVCFAIGASTLAGMIFHRRVYTLGLTAYCAVNGAWIFSYLASYVYAISDRSWITALNYVPELAAAGVLLLIGPPPPLVGKEE